MKSEILQALENKKEYTIICAVGQDYSISSVIKDEIGDYPYLEKLKEALIQLYESILSKECYHAEEYYIYGIECVVPNHKQYDKYMNLSLNQMRNEYERLINTIDKMIKDNADELTIFCGDELKKALIGYLAALATTPTEYSDLDKVFLPIISVEKVQPDNGETYQIVAKSNCNDWLHMQNWHTTGDAIIESVHRRMKYNCNVYLSKYIYEKYLQYRVDKYTFCKLNKKLIEGLDELITTLLPNNDDNPNYDFYKNGMTNRIYGYINKKILEVNPVHEYIIPHHFVPLEVNPDIVCLASMF